MSYVIGIVGAGPRFLYILERLSALLTKQHFSKGLKVPIEIHCYDPSGQFGPGCHNVNQPDSNWLNVIARHISRTPDATVKIAKLDEFPAIIPNQRLSEFIQDNLGEPDFDPDDYPQRKKLGLFYQQAVTDIEYALLAHKVPVTIVRKSEKVVDLITCNHQKQIVSFRANGERQTTLVDYAILTTGHPQKSLSSQWSKDLEVYVNNARLSGRRVSYSSNNLDVRETMSLHNIPPRSSVGLQGEGLDAIDKILYLTEGRGGRFFRNGLDELVYQPSKNFLEPSMIVTFSNSNFWVSTKGRNEKGDLQYQAHFFTFNAIRQLRNKRLKNSGTTKLDFQSDIFPLIYLDMAFEFYRIRQGEQFAFRFKKVASENMQKIHSLIIKNHPNSSRDSTQQKAVFIKNILIPIAKIADLFYYSALLGGTYINDQSLANVTSSQERPFNLLAMIDPFYDRTDIYSSLENYKNYHLQLMKKDILQGKAGNQTSPEKAATTALNDMVNNLRMLVDHRGLTAKSEHFYREIFQRHIFNKLAPAIPVKSKEKLLALVNAGILNISLGQHVYAAGNPDQYGFILRSPMFKNIHAVDHLVIARIPQISGTAGDRNLPAPYKTLVEKGEFRFYVNADLDGYRYHTDSIDVDSHWHPIKPSGSSHDNVIVLGIPIESTHWHSNLLARIHSDSTAWSQASKCAFMIMQDINHCTTLSSDAFFRSWKFAHSLPTSHAGKTFKIAAQVLEERQSEKGFEDASIIDMSQGDPGSEPIALVKTEMHRAIDFMPFGKYRFDVIPHCYRISIFRHLKQNGVDYKALIHAASPDFYTDINITKITETIDALLDDPDISGANLFIANYYYYLSSEQHQPYLYDQSYSRQKLLADLKLLNPKLNLIQASRKLKFLSQSIKKLKILSGSENCKASLSNCLRMFAGQYVLCPSGIYQAFSDLPANMDKQWQIIDTTNNEDYKITPYDIEQWLVKNPEKAQKINCLFITDPSNPAGAIYTRSEKLALVSLCRQYGIPIVEDSVYSGIEVSDVSYTSITTLYPEGSISFKSMGKLFSSPALRLGFAYGTPDLITQFSTYTRNTTGFLPTVPAVGAAAILEYTTPEYYLRNNALYKKRMQFVKERIIRINHSLGTHCHESYKIQINEPKGGYFLLLNMDCLRGHYYSCTDKDGISRISVVRGSIDITRLFIHYQERGRPEIAVRLPPTTSQGIFDSMCQVRISVGRDSIELLEEGLRRIEHILIGNYHRQEQFRKLSLTSPRFTAKL